MPKRRRLPCGAAARTEGGDDRKRGGREKNVADHLVSPRLLKDGLEPLQPPLGLRKPEYQPLVESDREHRLAIAVELGRADALHFGQLVEIARFRRGDLAQRRIVEDHIRRHARFGGELAAGLAQGFEQRIGGAFVALAPAALARGGGTAMVSFSSPFRIGRRRDRS